MNASAGDSPPVRDEWLVPRREAVREPARPETRIKTAEFGRSPVGSTPAQPARFVDGEIQRWTALIRQTGIKAD